MRTIHKSVVLLACGVLVLASLSALADDKKGNSVLSGEWQKKDGHLKIEFCDKNTIKIYPHGDKAEIAIICSYTAGKNGVIKAKIKEFAGKAEVTEKVKGIVPVGSEFSFKCTVKDKVATLDDVKGENVDAIKSHLEGEYEQKN